MSAFESKSNDFFFSIYSSGFGFVSFETDDPVERLVAEHFVNLNGKQV